MSADRDFNRYIDKDDLEKLQKDPDFRKVLKETDEESEDFVESDQEVFNVPKNQDSDALIDNPDFSDFFEEEPKTSKRRKRKITQEEVKQKLFEEDENELEDETDTLDDETTKVNQTNSVRTNGVIPEVDEFIKKKERLKKQSLNDQETFDDNLSSKEEGFYEDEYKDDYENEDDDLDDIEEDEIEEDSENEGYEEEEIGGFDANLTDVLFAPPKPKTRKNFTNGVSSANQEAVENNRMKDFTQSLKNKRKGFWDDLKSKSEDEQEEVVDAEPEEEKVKSRHEFKKNINTQINKEQTSFLSFCSKKVDKIEDGKIHYSLTILFDKLSLLGFSKEEAKTLIEYLKASTINKLTSIFSSVELTTFHLMIMKEMRTNIETLQKGSGSINYILSELLHKPKVLIHNVKFNRPNVKIKIKQTNYGLLPTNFINKVNVPSIDYYIKSTRRQYIFSGILKTGMRVEGVLIPLDKVPKGKNNIVNLFTRFGFTTHKPEGSSEELVYMFLGKDQSNNKSVYLIK